MPRVVPEYKDQARSRIVDAAAAVIRRKGLPGGTMDEIARELGVSKGALYLYFPTKARLLEAVQTRFRKQYLEVLERQLAHGDVVEGIVRSVDGMLSGEFDPVVFHQLVTSSGADPEIREAIRADARGDRRELRRVLARLERDGRIPRMGDPVATVDAVLLLLQGTFTAAALRAEPTQVREEFARALRLVLGVPSRAARRARAPPGASH